MPLPPDFLERLHEIVPPERLDGVMQAYDAPPSASFRINALRVQGEAEQAGVLGSLRAEGVRMEPIPWARDAFAVPPEDRDALVTSRAFEAQQVYVQNPSSMIPPLVIGAALGAEAHARRILDLAAAPGSKTLQLAALMDASARALGAERSGTLAAVEVVKPRFFRMRANLEAQGAPWVETYLQDGGKVGGYRPEHFDAVLLDAPCSSEGRFSTREPETTAYWSLRKIKEMARKQRRLLASAVQALRPGGTLVYATCSLAPEENEAVLDRALRRAGGTLRLEPLTLPGGEVLDLPNAIPPLQSWRGKRFKQDLSRARRILPTPQHHGFFVARLRKADAA
jgi:16S rRNA (cytosine1407-C5)-methyltransferase